MSEFEERRSSGRQDNTVLWVIGGLVVACVCGIAVVIVAMFLLGGLAFFGVSQGAAQALPATSAYIVIPTATTIPAGQMTPVDEDQTGVTFNLPDLGRDHVQEGATVVYNSNPPTSGPHYPKWLQPGFYTDSAPDGYLVHNLEHGYVIIWYDCETLSEDECTALQDDIEGVIKASSQTKLIGIPREGMPHPIALTTWTRLAYLDEFDSDFIEQFITDHILQAPEPGGQ